MRAKGFVRSLGQCLIAGYALLPAAVAQAISGSYELPFGRGRRFLTNANGLVNNTLGGWQLQSIVIVRSGVPYTPVIGRRPRQYRGGWPASRPQSCRRQSELPAFRRGLVR